MQRTSSIPHIVACLQARSLSSALARCCQPGLKLQRTAGQARRLPSRNILRGAASTSRAPSLPSQSLGPTSPPEAPPRSTRIRDGKGYLVACMFFGAVLGVYVMSLGVNFRNARKRNKELDLQANADVSYRWKDEKRNFDLEVDNAEFYMSMRPMRRRLINEAYGNVLEVSVGTGRNFELYDLRPYDKKEDAKYGRSRRRIVTGLTFNDQSEVMVDHAIAKYRDMEEKRREDEHFKGKVRFIVGDAGNDGVIDRPAGGYDTIVQTFGICSMADPVGFLRKLGKLCRQPGEASTSELPEEENDSKGGRILLLEHGRSHYNWVNNILDSIAKVHALNYGCWWNKEIQDVIDRTGLEVERVKRYHAGTTWEVVLRPKGKSKS